ncbi:MAG: hypothetical protein OXQ30_02560, partial [Boseongicola sp.]|nr:hypothetical protein [Boseongicola sp.]
SLLDELDAPFELDLTGKHPAIRQDAALLTTNEGVDIFWDYLDSDVVRDLIEESGLLPPE